ncbi:MAG: aspartate aminotransferase family protein [Pseudomonadales bacterium]|jgi:acetylornithine/N-succinyldiaminopimelate aminotransferase|nr:aspartate aminotransferase family protein [Pseudomonadales bacterium]
MNTIDTEDTLGLSFCERLPLAFTHGQGSWVWDEAGKRYLDFTSGWGVTCLGHAHPLITHALTRQAARLLQSPNAGFTYSPERAALLRLLQPLLPGELSALYFCNSGAEANDAALKLARKITGRSKIISTHGAFHGRSFNTLSVSRGPENAERYLPLLPAISFVPYGDGAALAQAMDSETAAVIVEPIQGEGGVQIAPEKYLHDAQRLCHAHGALLIVDEVQTGFGRTGKLFALQHSSTPLQPDILTLAKGIAGGFPFAAFAVTAAVRAQLHKDDHGGTYCGNPLGCALAHAVITHLVEHNIPEQVAHKGRQLLDGLHTLQHRHATLVREVRGLGLLCALEFHDATRARELTLRCADQGLLVVPTRNGIIRLLPDLLVSTADITTALAMLDGVLAEAR